MNQETKERRNPSFFFGSFERTLFFTFKKISKLVILYIIRIRIARRVQRLYSRRFLSHYEIKDQENGS